MAMRERLPVNTFSQCAQPPPISRIFNLLPCFLLSLSSQTWPAHGLFTRASLPQQLHSPTMRKHVPSDLRPVPARVTAPLPAHLQKERAIEDMAGEVRVGRGTQLG